MTVDFSEYFWGESQKHNGIDILFQNTKLGVASTKEVAEFLKERSSIEEVYFKSLEKLSAKYGSPPGAGGGGGGGHNHSSSFSPIWQLIKSLTEKVAVTHSQVVTRVEDLLRDVVKYADELQKQYKSIKVGEAATVESVQQYQNSKTMTAKTKAVYMQRHLELEKCQKEGVPQKDLEKADARMKKAQDEYKSWAEKYQNCSEDYVAKMTDSCRRFQSVETSYLEKMKAFMVTYSAALQQNYDLAGKLTSQFQEELAALTIEELLQQLVRQKATGNTRPNSVAPEFTVDENLLNFEISQQQSISVSSNEDKSSSGSVPPVPLDGNSLNLDKPLNKTYTVLPQPTTENMFEGNGQGLGSMSVSASAITLPQPIVETKSSASSKGSRRTTSLLNLFIPHSSQGSKATAAAGKAGIDSPTSLAGTEVDIPSVITTTSSPNNGNATAPTLSRSNNRGSKWFLRSKRGKKKDKNQGMNISSNSGKQEDSVNVSQDEPSEASLQHSVTSEGDKGLSVVAGSTGLSLLDSSSPKVDAEGFTIRPTNVWEEETDKFYSSSDTDSEEPDRKLRVEIKPLTNGTSPLSASVDELRTTVENMTLSSSALMSRKVIVDVESQMKRSQSVSQQIGCSSPPSHYPYAPLSSPMTSTVHADNKASPIPGHHSQQPQQNDIFGRYADLGDLFDEVGEIQPSLPPKKTSLSRATPTSGGVYTMAIPRPPSRPRPEIPLISQRSTNSPSPVVSRTDSIASLETKSIGGSSRESRGPSPLTLGMADSIPIAIAFHEIVHAYFKGNDENLCKVKMTGDMMVSFPAGIMQVFTSNPSPAQLSFRVRSQQLLENLIPNKALVKIEPTESALNFEFDMSALITLLKNHAEQNPNASYFNIDILKYQIKPKPGANSCPLHLVAFWKCQNHQTDLRVDYKYNSHAMEPTQSETSSAKSSPSMAGSGSGNHGAALSQVCIAAPVDGGVKVMQSKPSGQWFSNTNRACWKLPALSYYTENHGVGSLRARFEVTSGPSSNGTIAAQFSCENSTLSGCEFELLGSGYRVSLVKKRFVSGKYICDSEENSNRYAVPPEHSKIVQL